MNSPGRAEKVEHQRLRYLAQLRESPLGPVVFIKQPRPNALNKLQIPGAVGGDHHFQFQGIRKRQTGASLILLQYQASRRGRPCGKTAARTIQPGVVAMQAGKGGQKGKGGKKEKTN